MEAAQPQQPASGMWAPYVPPEIGEPLDTLDGLSGFVLLAAKVREGVGTQYGPRDVVDLTVATAEAGVTRLFSGFSAGIVGQAKRLQANDLPAVCRVVETEVGRGKTRGLELLQFIAAEADSAAIARAQTPALMPLKGHDPNDPIPY